MSETHTFTIDNAIILAAGYSSRLAPLSDVCPKALLPVRGEILIERQIRQLMEAGISQIYVVVGYMKERFAYLTEKFPVTLIENPEYDTRNNHSSIFAAKKYLRNSYICSADNYFPYNPFTLQVARPYYSALHAKGSTEEYCLTTDDQGRITNVQIGGKDSWYMLGHVCVDEAFSRTFLALLEEAYPLEETKPLLWEHIYMKHLDKLCLYQKEYPSDYILEFDTFEDLQAFDSFYNGHSAEEIRDFLEIFCNVDMGHHH